MSTAPSVSVVVPFYERQDQLERLLAGLDAQRLDPSCFEVVVADDGSRVAPRVGERAYRTSVVRQQDNGFRAAAARNLGARASAAPILAFVDQDCVPEPGYLQQMVAAASSPWSMVLGHRRHADLEGWSPDDVGRWLGDSRRAPDPWAEPQWLLDGYARTADLTEPDARAYQLVISAVLTLHRDLFELIGGFDEGFQSYGGEDWDLGHRALVAGADTRWLPDAVVWHDGPDLAGRPEDLVRVKNAETLALAKRVPDRDLRGEHLVWSVPDIVVELAAGGASTATLVASIESLLAGSDAHVWVDDLSAGNGVLAVVEDPRVHSGRPPADILARARYRVRCEAVLLSGLTLRALSLSAPVKTRGFQLRSTREENRSARGCGPSPAPRWPAAATAARLGEEPVLERLWQR